ncbi:hypothetical protein LWI29_025594 [Acer saccharum]|uniref:Uncharacterized protein n=1 Tax=Acer saccharum TaxID=4024 RepID=A0AA39T625_ACESA|nr:hypothetical protein LWI29_025594 [Acer saccharum]
MNISGVLSSNTYWEHGIVIGVVAKQDTEIYSTIHSVCQLSGGCFLRDFSSIFFALSLSLSLAPSFSSKSEEVHSLLHSCSRSDVADCLSSSAVATTAPTSLQPGSPFGVIF